MKDILSQRAFTLIELVIVVLVIAVLVAVAVPQYQKAVLKSRFSSLMPLAKTLAQGNEDYYLRNGQYTNDVNKLDIKASGNNKAQITLGNEDKHKYVLLTRNDMNNNLVMYQKNSKYFPGEIHCEAQKNNSQANWLCADGLKGTLLTERALSDGYNTYLLQGEGNGGFPKTWKDINDQILERGDSCTTSYATAACNNITVTDGECKPGNAGYWSCRHSIFNHSTCEGYAACGSSTFTNGSVCNSTGYATCSGAGLDNHDAIFDNSTCNGYSGGCAFGTFTNNSICNANATSRDCTYSDFDHSVCYGGSAQSCTHNAFKNGSVCYASFPAGYPNTPCLSVSYDPTSYCAGDYCPNGSPSGTAGKKWYRGTGEDWPDDRPSELVDK